MRIGIIGSGGAGRTLARGLTAKGHLVCVGTRDPAKLAEWQKSDGNGIEVCSASDAVRNGELVILSVMGSAMIDAIGNAGIENFSDKIVIDASDPLDFSSGKPGLFVGTNDSLGEQVQRMLPKAKVVKAFNTVAAEVMIEPGLSGGDPDMFIAGNDSEAKIIVSALLASFGWPVIDLGGIENARWLEALSLTWVVYSHNTGKVRHAFKLIGK